ncbi:MAG: CotH kinase family protein [Rikenellaceae bacterium]|nr:CotH kinase family protein [Rikenellaceae bacterium]
MKKLLFSMLIGAVALLGACKDPVPTPPTPPTPESATFFTFTIKKADNSGLTEDLIFTAGEDGVFTCKVPYFINRSSLIPSFTVPVGCFVVAQSKTQISGKTAVNFSQPVVYTIKTSDGKSAAVTVKLDIGYAGLSGLPVVVINTEKNQAIKDKDTWIPAKMLIDDGKGNVAFAEADAEVKGRGNTTWTYDKKPYAIKLGSKAEVLGMPKHKRWVLLASWNDKAMLRTDLTFFMAQKYTTFRWKQRGKAVELILNGEHLGHYYLCEQIKVDDNRVPDGYVLEIDYRAKEANGDIFFKSDISELNFVLKDPEPEKGSDEYNYAQKYINNIEKLLKDGDVEGYRSYLNMESFVDWYLNQEFSMNMDACFFLSVYMNIGEDGKLYMGPLWDFDIAFGNDVFPEGEDNHIPEGFYIYNSDRSKLWMKVLRNDEEFLKILKERYAAMRADKDNILAYIDDAAAAQYESAVLNDKKWHKLCKAGASREQILKAYDAEVQFLKDWVEGRFAWLDENIPNL